MRRIARGIVVVAMAVAVAGLAGCAGEQEPLEQSEIGELGKADKLDCSLVRCALPLCAQGQHLSYQGGCCPVCVGPDSRCAAVLCAAVECPAGQERVFSNGQCCGKCVAKHAVKQCSSDADCPQYYCIQCPCPYSECRGGSCVTQTPDASTCGNSL